MRKTMAPERTEHEKMLAGELYDAGDPGLAQARARARRLTGFFNRSNEGEDDLRASLLRELLGSMGTNVLIEPSFSCDYGSTIHIGNDVAINFNCVILDSTTVRIGDHVLFGPSVQIYTAHHPVSPVDRLRGLELASPVTIGENVWIGGGAIVCPGVTIGAGTTIGAGSVVVRDIPAGVLAVGNPCRVVRRV